MDKQKALRILAELERRKLRVPEWLDPDFPAQNAFITSPSRRKAVQCTRRAGKSYGAGIYACKEAYETPGVSVVIVGLTRDSVKRIFFKDILKVIDKKFDLEIKFNASDLTATLPNGSVIYLLGIDANPDDMNKLLGQKNKLVIIDEAAFFRQDMAKIVYEIIMPSLTDYRGTLALISTTSNLTDTLYHKITSDREPGWELFKWTAYENPHMAEQWDEEIKSLIKHNPAILETPMYKRMYLNEWHVDEDALIYRYNSTRNDHPEALYKESWNYVLGIDLGYNDATAFVVCAYSDYDPNLYVIETYKESGMIVSAVADKIKELSNKYEFQTMIVDNASKQVVEELKQRYYLPLIAAEKRDKRDFIELLNSDLITGNIKLLAEAEDLIVEWKALVWDERQLLKGKHVEHPACPNHLSDAFLYAWRHVYNYSSKPKGIPPPKGSEAEVDHFWESEAEKLNNTMTLWQEDQ